MSKNIVDSIIEFTEETGRKLGFIPSRRQIDHDGGYVNGWTTQGFAEYVKGRVPIGRDHGGAAQGYENDDGETSFRIDSKYLDIIHIDPWKAFPKYKDGLERTITSIKDIHTLNQKILFEVGTEEAIRPFSPQELEKLVSDLAFHLPPEMFNNIKYAVVQSGVGLDLGKKINTGTFDEDRLSAMVKTCREFNILSKEHNGDYLTNKEMGCRFALGLDAINIAPEFGQIETQVYLEYIEKISPNLLEKLYNICYRSNRWKKWVDEDFLPENDKSLLISICGHYVLSNPIFLSTIKRECVDIDTLVKARVKGKLEDLFD